MPDDRGQPDGDDVAAMLRDAVPEMTASGGIPAPRKHADWFREVEPWLTTTYLADHTVALVAAGMPIEAGRLLDAAGDAADRAGPEGREVLDVGFIEALVCAASHEAPAVADGVRELAPPVIRSEMAARRRLLTTLAGRHARPDGDLRGLHSSSPGVRAVARGTTFRTEAGHHLSLAEIVSSDDPSPWLLRHPVTTGVLFLAVLTTFFVLAVVTG